MAEPHTSGNGTDGSEERFDFTFKIDGRDIPARQGDTILQAALRAGEFIPHYCYHPGLSVAGNCRICLVFATKAGPPNKPVIACATQAVEGMEVESAGPRTKAVREGVMEFLLINHPLDCPVCDQAGECDLQQYSFDYGREKSRYVEEKSQRPRKDLGPLIRYVGNRCIVCTRCVRFTDEVTGTGELAVVQRGDSSSIDVFPGTELDNPLSGCVADICPVGALLDRDSIHTTRTWLLRGTRSLCGSCATGCNVNVETWEDEVKRLTPRENQAVNRWWMCDEGRLSWKPQAEPERVTKARLDGAESWHLPALERAQALVREAVAEAAQPGKEGGLVAVVASGYATNEELFLLHTLAGDGPIGVTCAADGGSWRSQDGFEISADKNPNREGARRVLGPDDDLQAVKDALLAGKVSLLVVADADPRGSAWDPALAVAFARAPRRIVLTLREGAHTAGAQVVLPALHWTEKDGTFVNGRGRVQRVRAAVPPPGDARSDLEVLQELLRARGAQPRVLSAAGVWRKLVAARPGDLGSADYNAIGALGLPLPGAEDHTPPARATTGYEAGPVSRQAGRADDEQVRISVHRTSPAGYGTPRGDH